MTCYMKGVDDINTPKPTPALCPNPRGSGSGRLAAPAPAPIAPRGLLHCDDLAGWDGHTAMVAVGNGMMIEAGDPGTTVTYPNPQRVTFVFLSQHAQARWHGSRRRPPHEYLPKTSPRRWAVPDDVSVL
jgi:hypothetical protein